MGKEHHKKDVETLDSRCIKLFNTMLTSSGPMHKKSGQPAITQDALLDTFLLLFDECCKEALKKDIHVSYFVNKYKTLSSEIRALRLGVDDFELSTIIGRGNFAQVRIAKEKATGDVYAIKIINKTKTLTSACGSLFEEERDVLCLASSPWLTSLHYAFQDPQNLYLVMEYLPGGDLMSLLERQGGKLCVEHARFYISETLVALHELHRMGYVHRDVKPENVLLDRMGHVKLGDFGSAARVCADGRVLTALPAGTPDYVAPEVLQSLQPDGEKKPYGVECDLWSVGVLAYTLVFGSSPFSAARTSVTYSRILSNAGVAFPDNVDETLHDVIRGLLRPAPTRLDYNDLRKHLFFIDVDFDSLREAVPPFVPVVAREEDTSNFSRIASKSLSPVLTPRDTSPKTFSGRQLPFIGYTYCGDLTSVKPPIPTPRVRSDALEIERKNQALLAKLLSAQEECKGNKRAELALQSAEKQLARHKKTVAALRKQLEDDREDRRRDEQKALLMAKQAQKENDRELLATTTELQAQLDNVNDRLTDAHTRNNELTSRCERAEATVDTLLIKLEEAENVVRRLQENAAKNKEMRRRSVTDVESQLEKIKRQDAKWHVKLNTEAQAKQNALKRAQDAMQSWTASEAQWRQERGLLEEQVRSLKGQLHDALAQVSAAQSKLSDTTKLDEALGRLADEQKECARFKAKVSALETDLSNTTASFLEHETVGQRTTIREQETERKALLEERETLKNQLDQMKEKQEADQLALSKLKKILERLERDSKLIEKENAELKAAQSDLDPPCVSDDESSYRRKIAALEQKLKRVEGQLERRLDVAILEKDQLMETQSKLRKTEKELADTRIEVRIAKREATRSEESWTKLRDEVSTLNERIKKMMDEREAMLAEQTCKLEQVRGQLKACQDEVEALRECRGEAKRLTDAHKTLQADYNTLRQQLLTSDRQLAAAQAEFASLQASHQTLANEKNSLELKLEEQQGLVSSLTLRNAVLEESVQSLDEYVGNYDVLVSNLKTEKEQLLQANMSLSVRIAEAEREKESYRGNAASEKSLHFEIQAQLDNTRAELTIKQDIIDELRKQVEVAKEACDHYAAQVRDRERQVQELEMDVNTCDQEIRQLQSECMFLREDLSAKITALYLMKEKSAAYQQELEDQNSHVELLTARTEELERTVLEQDTVHKNHELKSKAQIQQLNKVITFQQAKLEEKNKKQYFGKLFGGKKREPPSPQAPLPLSPHAKNSRDQIKATPSTPRKKSTDSPRTALAKAELTKSPSSRMHRQLSLPRMQHKIPHRFKTQSIQSSCKCVSCDCDVPRGSKGSVCAQCGAVAHARCAMTAAKTCGLPAGLAKQFLCISQQVEKENMTEGSANDGGWLSLIMPGENMWKKRFVKLLGSELCIYEQPPSSADSPFLAWPLVKPGGHTIVSADVTADEVSVAKTDLPFIFKVSSISSSSCWPNEVLCILAASQPAKIMWITALEAAISSYVPADITPANLVLRFTDSRDFQVNCALEISSRVCLLGTNAGLFAAQSPTADPVQIHGLTSAHSLVVAQSVNQLLMVVGQQRQLVTADYRLVVSNCYGAACTNRGVETEMIALEDDREVHLVRTADVNGSTYLTAATDENVHLLRWCAMSSEFRALHRLPSQQQTACALFWSGQLLIGSDTFHALSLDNYSLKGIFNSAVSQSLLRMSSYPMEAFILNDDELLLCYKEFGVFVEKGGNRSRPDLKWASTPKQFAFKTPLLYIVCANSVELLRLSLCRDSAADDAMSIATTATISDSVAIPLQGSTIRGETQTGILLSIQRDLNELDGTKLYPTLDRVASVGQFSFTSSLVGSLDDSGSCPPSPVQHTEL